MRALATPLARAAAFGTPSSRRRGRDARRHRASATTRDGASASASPRDERPAVFVERVEIEADADGEETNPVAVACAELRAQNFYVYDPLAASSDGSILFGEAAARAKTRWREKRAKIEARRMRQMTPLGMRVSTYAATCRAPSDAQLAMENAAVDAREENAGGGAWTRGGGGGADASTTTTETETETPPTRCVTPESSRGGARTEVVGTLDVHVGARLPGELLEGKLPSPTGAPLPTKEDFAPFDDDDDGGGGGGGSADPFAVAVAAAAAFANGGDGVLPWAPPAGAAEEDGDGDRDTGRGYAGGGALNGERAYLFNVCVAPHRRRQNIASRLLRAAHRGLSDAGVKYAYVHVELGNVPAMRLYAREGYAVETEESEWLAGKLGRSPRALMVKTLSDDG